MSSEDDEGGCRSSNPRKRPTALQIAVTAEAGDIEPPLCRWLKARLRKAAGLAGVCAGRLDVMLVDDAAMSRLHEQYKQEAGTTDVLTFDLGGGVRQGAVDVDLVLCVDEARRQAASRGHGEREELLLYAVHGLLHVLGYDDHAAGAARAMHTREDELLTELGVGPVFRRPTRSWRR